MNTATKTPRSSAKLRGPALAPAYIRKAPDAVMAQLWRVKAQLNQEAGYSIDQLLVRARRSATAAKAATTH